MPTEHIENANFKVDFDLKSIFRRRKFDSSLLAVAYIFNLWLLEPFSN